MREGGSARAVELFLRHVCGDTVYDGFDPALRARCQGNGEVMFGMEMEPVLAYLPEPAELVEIQVPCAVVAGADHAAPAHRLHWLYEASQWMASQLAVPLLVTPGGHQPQADHLDQLLETLHPFLDDVSRREVQPSVTV